MAIVTETFEINGRAFVRTYSDAGRYVVGGCPEGAYSEAIDPAELNRTYVEGELMPDEERSDVQDKAEALDYEKALEELGVDFSD